MMTIVLCSYCGFQGSFPIELKVEYRRERCDTCYHSREFTYTYYFCATDCLVEWRARMSVNGVLFLPCQSCRKTGFAHGFESNGSCKNCEGQGEIEVGHSNHKNKENNERLLEMERQSDEANHKRRSLQDS